MNVTPQYYILSSYLDLLLLHFQHIWIYGKWSKDTHHEFLLWEPLTELHLCCLEGVQVLVGLLQSLLPLLHRTTDICPSSIWAGGQGKVTANHISQHINTFPSTVLLLSKQRCHSGGLGSETIVLIYLQRQGAGWTDKDRATRRITADISYVTVSFCKSRWLHSGAEMTLYL